MITIVTKPTVLCFCGFILSVSACIGCTDSANESDENSDSNSLSDDSDNSDNETDTGSVEEDTSSSTENFDCTALDKPLCLENATCSAIEGRAVDTTNECLKPIEVLGCVDADVICDEAEVFTTGPDGTCWWFSSTCFPTTPGWNDGGTDMGNNCNNSEEFPLCNNDCTDLNEAYCLEDSTCVVIEGMALDKVNECLRLKEFVGCRYFDIDCGQAEVFTTGPDGTCWWFSNTCFPTNPGWNNGGTDMGNNCNNSEEFSPCN